MCDLYSDIDRVHVFVRKMMLLWEQFSSLYST